jgi:hypothetical protein
MFWIEGSPIIRVAMLTNAGLLRAAAKSIFPMPGNPAGNPAPPKPANLLIN